MKSKVIPVRLELSWVVSVTEDPQRCARASFEATTYNYIRTSLPREDRITHTAEAGGSPLICRFTSLLPRRQWRSSVRYVFSRTVNEGAKRRLNFPPNAPNLKTSPEKTPIGWSALQKRFEDSFCHQFSSSSSSLVSLSSRQSDLKHSRHTRRHTIVFVFLFAKLIIHITKK